eukprot:SM000046S16385  [mRNA]  locus=s46:315411:318400:+ [translate_table: standard]
MHPPASSREARPSAPCTTSQIPVWLSKWLPRRLGPKAATQVLIKWAVQALTATTIAKPPVFPTTVRLRLSSWHPLMAPGGAQPPLDLFPPSATAATTATAAAAEGAVASSTVAADLSVEPRAPVQLWPGGSLRHPGEAAASPPPPQYTSLQPLPSWQLQTVGGSALAAGVSGGHGTMIDDFEHGGSEAEPKTDAFEDSSASPRTQHSKTEQRRRNRINERFQVLQDLVPRRATSGKRDKASFLLEVIDHVRWLHAKMEWYEQELKQLHAGTATAAPHHDNLLVRRGMPPSTSYGATAPSPQAQQGRLLVGDAAADTAAASSTPYGHLVEPTVRLPQLTDVHVGSSSGGGGSGTPVVVQPAAAAQQQQQVWWLLMQQQAALRGQQLPARAPPMLPPWQAAEHTKRQREAAEVAEGERHQQSMRLDQGHGGGGSVSQPLTAAPAPAVPSERPHARLFGHSLEPAGVKQSPDSSGSDNG